MARSEQEIAEMIMGCVVYGEETGDHVNGEVDGRFFSDAGVMTSNEGLILKLADGSEYQVTVVRSK